MFVVNLVEGSGNIYAWIKQSYLIHSQNTQSLNFVQNNQIVKCDEDIQWDKNKYTCRIVLRKHKHVCISQYQDVIENLPHQTWGPTITPQPFNSPKWLRDIVVDTQNPVGTLTSIIFLRSFSNMTRTFIVLNLLRVQFGGSASLGKCIMDHLMSRSILAFLGLFLKLNPLN